MKRKNNVTIEEILDAITLQESEPSHKAMVQWCKDFPEYREEIADFFAAWAVGTEGEDRCVIDENRVANRMLSHALNLLHTLKVKDTANQQQQVRLFKLIEQSGETEESLFESCNLDDSIIAKLDRKLINFKSIPRKCIQTLAAKLKVADQIIASAFSGMPVLLTNYKSKTQPVARQEDFIDAVNSSDLSEDKKKEWERIVNSEQAQ